MYSTLPNRKRDPAPRPELPNAQSGAEQKEEASRARRSSGRTPLPAFALFLLGALVGVSVFALCLVARVQLTGVPFVQKDSQPYQDDPEINKGSDPSYSLPRYAGESSHLSIDFSEHEGEALSAVQLYEQRLACTVSLTVYAGKSAAYGSGMVLTEDGFLLTCAHVVNNSQSCTVALPDGREFEAELMGMDTQTDLAVLKIDAQDLTPVSFCDSDTCVVGETVYAIGDPVRPEFRSSLTTGILSGLDRQVSSKSGTMRLLQTTAPINSGNSGGPLFNAWGQVIGVVNMKLSRQDGGTSIENMGMAVPSRTVKQVVEELARTGTVTRAVLGITCQPIGQARARVNGVPEGLWITTIDPYSDVGNHDIRVGDIITAANGVPVNSILAFRDVIESLRPGDSVTLTIWRDESLLERLEAQERAEASALPEADASAPEEAYAFHLLGDVEVKLVDGALLSK